MNATVENQTIALAGLFQCAEIVQSIATNGSHQESETRTVLESLFTLDADSVPAVYGDERALSTGMRRLVTQLAGSDAPPNAHITHYVLTLFKIESNLRHADEAMNRIRRAIQETQKLQQHYDTMDDRIITALAAAYSHNVSPVRPRVMVQGKQTHLQNDSLANLIRAVLLAGLRGAVLWRHCGGSRWRLLSRRKAYVEHAAQQLRVIH